MHHDPRLDAPRESNLVDASGTRVPCAARSALAHSGRHEPGRRFGGWGPKIG